MTIEAESYRVTQSICFTITPPTGIALHWPQIPRAETWKTEEKGAW